MGIPSLDCKQRGYRIRIEDEPLDLDPEGRSLINLLLDESSDTELHITTSPEGETEDCMVPDTFRTVLRAIERFDPRQLIVTGGAGAAETEDMFRLNGLMEVVEQEGATLVDRNGRRSSRSISPRGQA